ncbi:hypothetical protein KX816_00405 [Sphingosinicellaceae bacterium]|nr:hypothetical protein KX816_00405 [Sphingosinicellaceae bacterium]
MKARTWLILVAVVLVALGGGFAWLKFGPQGKRAYLASGYVAHVVCSCRYAGGRDMKSCATDFEPGMEIVQMSDDPAAKRITAWVPGIARRSASFKGEYGCSFDD